LTPAVRHVVEANIRAIRSYTPRPYPGRAVLFMTLDEPIWDLHDHRLIWSRLADEGLEIRTLPGNHDSLLEEPEVTELAEKLRACIDQARALTSGRS
jgi:thioesterase domain-containing protein